MTIPITVDGSPFLVTFAGTIDIERMVGSSTVMIRGVSDDANVIDIQADQQKIEQTQQLIEDVTFKCEYYNRQLSQIKQTLWLSPEEFDRLYRGRWDGS